MLFTNSIVRSLLVGLLVLSGDVPDSPGLRSRAEEFVAAFQAGQIESLLHLWSSSAASQPADRRRMSRLIEEQPELDMSITSVVEEASHGVVRVEVRRKGTPAIELEQYNVEFKLEDGQWRVLSLKSSQAAEVAQLLAATPEQRDRLMQERAPTVALTRELLQIGFEHLDTGQIPKAVPVLALAADLAERTGDVPTRVTALRALGRLDSVRGDFAGATGHYESSLKLSESSGYQRGVAKALNNLANIDRMTGEYARAASRWSAALDLYRQDGDKREQANVLSNMGTLHSTQGDYPEAMRKLEESLRIFEELDDTHGRILAHNNLGIVFRLQGEYREALDHFQKALELSRGVDDLAGVANTLGNSANVFWSQGNYIKALQAYEESLAIGERLGSVSVVLGGLTGVANIYATLGNYPQALEHLEKAYALVERTRFKQGIAFTLHEIGAVRERQGEPDRALEYYKKALTAETEMGERSEIASLQNDIGKAYALLGKQNEARSSFEKGLEIAKQINDRETMVQVLVNLAELAKKPEDYQWGLDFAQQAMKIASEMGLAEQLWQAHLVLARLYRRMGRFDEARTEVQSAIATVEEVRRDIPGEQLAQQAFESMVLPYHEMVGILVAQGDIANAFEYAERAKGRVLLDVMRQGRSDVSHAMTIAERAREQQLVGGLAQLNRELREELSASANRERVAELRSKLRKARLDYEAFLPDLYAAHPQLRVARGEMLPVRASDLDALLTQEAADAFLEFVVTDEATYVFVLNRGGDLVAHTIAISRKELDKDVTRFRERLAGRELTYAPASRALFNKLIRPVDARLRNARQICIVPDGSLWELPFQALQPAPGRFLLDRHAIFYAPSMTVLRETVAKRKVRAAGPRPTRLLAFGNPVVPSEVASEMRSAYRDASLGPLPHAETEVKSIASLYGARDSRVHVREDAREELVKSEAETFRVLHFATHGILDDESPLYSHLLFSRPTSAAEDGVLEAHEIMRLNLDADLAVLSACETGRGRVGAGEGLIGMSWAFFVAGCPTSVVSQWKVNSASTTELMIEFHRALRSASPKTRAEALRRASLKVRSSSAYRHPFYWAPFVLVGDGR